MTPAPPDAPPAAAGLDWRESLDGLDWPALSAMYAEAGLGNKTPAVLETSFGNSRYVVIVRDPARGGALVAAGRALADGADCSYLADIAVIPALQGRGLGRAITERLVERSRGHKKILLYAVKGKEPVYRKVGFRRMTTAMAIFEDQDGALARGMIVDD